MSRPLALSDSQLAVVVLAASTVPVGLRWLFLENLSYRLELQPINDATVQRAVASLLLTPLDLPPEEIAAPPAPDPPREIRHRNRRVLHSEAG